VDIILVEWVDSSFQHGWHSRATFNKELSIIVSVGFLLEENEDMVALAQGYDKDEENFADGVVIPRVSVRALKKGGSLE